MRHEEILPTETAAAAAGGRELSRKEGRNEQLTPLSPVFHSLGRGSFEAQVGAGCMAAERAGGNQQEKSIDSAWQKGRASYIEWSMSYMSKLWSEKMLRKECDS